MMHVTHFVDKQIQACAQAFSSLVDAYYMHAHTYTHSILQLCSVSANDACQANLCTNTSTKALYYLIKWCMSYTRTHTLPFVLCDQMMRVAVKLVTSIQQCPILFCSHPYCATVLLMLCKHISCLCMSVTLHCSPMKYGFNDTLYV